MKIPTRFALSTLAVGALFCTAALAQDDHKGHDHEKDGHKHADKAPNKAELNEQAPDFELKGVDGKAYRLSDYSDKVVVLVWLNQDCPFVEGRGKMVGAKEMLKDAHKKYAQKGVVFLGIDSTHYQTVEKNKEWVNKNNIEFPLLMDSDGAVGRKYGAKTTPHVFVIDEGTLVYRGGHDNGGRGKTASRNYIAETLDKVLADEKVTLQETKSYGCSVKYARKGSTDRKEG